MEVDRLPHFLGAAVLARVDAAHGALQLGQLAHHVGGQVGFAQPSRFGRVIGEVRAAQDVGADPARQLLHARGLFLVGAQLLVEQHGAEPLDVIGERLLAIGVVEEPRIPQPRGQHALHVAEITSGCSGCMLSTARNTGCSLPWSFEIGKKC